MALRDFFGALGAAAGRTPVPRDGSRQHRVTVTIGSEQIDGWTGYEIECSMVTPADGFRLTRPFDKRAWDLCRLDEKVRITIDGTVMMEGFIDDRARSTSDRTLEIAGRDKSGRLVQESIPTVSGFDGLQLTEAVKRLATPWYTSVTLSDARNRSVRRGKGHRAAAGGEPAFFRVTGKVDEDNAGRVDPGQRRWEVIEQLCSSIGIMAWSSADGRELVLGQPNYKQAVQYLLRHGGSGSTVKNMTLRESLQEAFAMIEVHGSGEGDDEGFGDDVNSYIGTAKDGPNADGTGGDFIHPKRLVVPQSNLQSHAEARRAAEREMKRRRFHRRQLQVEAPLHGQIVAGTVPTLFAPNTLARVIDEELELDETWLIYTCAFAGSRGSGETTRLELVPRGTEFVS